MLAVKPEKFGLSFHFTSFVALWGIFAVTKLEFLISLEVKSQDGDAVNQTLFSFLFIYFNTGKN